METRLNEVKLKSENENIIREIKEREENIRKINEEKLIKEMKEREEKRRKAHIENIIREIKEKDEKIKKVNEEKLIKEMKEKEEKIRKINEEKLKREMKEREEKIRKENEEKLIKAMKEKEIKENEEIEIKRKERLFSHFFNEIKKMNNNLEEEDFKNKIFLTKDDEDNENELESSAIFSESFNTESEFEEEKLFAIRQFEELTYDKIGKFSDVIKSDKCIICQIQFKKNDIINIFTCYKHIFHKRCLKHWMKRANFCPICKFNIMDSSYKTLENI